MSKKISIATIRKMERVSLMVYGTLVRIKTLKQVGAAISAESRRHGRALKAEEKDYIRKVMLDHCDLETSLRAIRYGDYNHFRQWVITSSLSAKRGRGRVSSGPEEAASAVRVRD